MVFRRVTLGAPGARQTMGDVKLSLHPADPTNGFNDNATISALTKEFAERNNLPKSQIVKWGDAPDVADGWRPAALILTPSITFTHTRLRCGGPHRVCRCSSIWLRCIGRRAHW